MIHLFKYNNKTSLKYPLLDLLDSFLKNYQIPLKSFDIVVPVPLHPVRIRERGYNQAQLLSEEISRKFMIPHSTHNLLRIHPTDHQALLGKKDRWTNIAEVFKIKNPFEFDKKSVLVVDDLLTTGVTASEIARILKEGGATKVGVLTAAIAL